MILRSFPRTCPPEGWPNLVLHAAAREVEYPEHPGPLSVKLVLRGEEIHELPGGARYAVRPGRYLLLEEDQRYGSWIRSLEPVETFSVFFRPGLAEEVARVFRGPEEQRLDDPEAGARCWWQGDGGGRPRFVEGLYPTGGGVAAALARLRAATAGSCPGSADAADELTLEELLRELLAALLEGHAGLLEAIDGVPAVRPATRHELYRRLKRARDFIDSSLGEPLDLQAMARVACLSPYHFLRRFRQLFGVTPGEYLARARIERAKELLADGDSSVTEVCFAVGFQSLGSFSDLFRRRVGVPPSRYRAG